VSRVLVLAVASSGLAATGATVSAAAKPEVAAAASSSLTWGAFVKPRGSQSQTQAVQALESTLGAKLPYVREFGSWDGTFPNRYTTWLRDTGHQLVWSVRPVANGHAIKWSAIASAQPGSSVYNGIVRWAKNAKAYGKNFYFAFNHEPEAAASSTFGSQADFIAAYRKFVTVFRAQHVTNVRFMWIMTEWSFDTKPSDRRYAAKWYPGDAWVDDLGADAYNDYTCPTGRDAVWKPLTTDIAAFRAFGLQHPSKGMWLPEFGSYFDHSDVKRKAAWLDQLRAALKTSGWSQFRGIMYFDSLRVGTSCQWWLDDSSYTMTAFKRFSTDSAWPRVAPAPQSSPTLLTTGAAGT